MNNSINDNREPSDRRCGPTPVLSKYAFWGGRRKTVRRVEDKSKHIFVDLYSTRLLIAVLLLLSLSCLDGYLTLELMSDGKVYEANPVMAYLMSYGVLPFTIVKFIVTASAIIVLCLFKNVRLTRYSLPLAIKIYIFIVAYELYLITL